MRGYFYLALFLSSTGCTPTQVDPPQDVALDSFVRDTDGAATDTDTDTKSDVNLDTATRADAMLDMDGIHDVLADQIEESAIDGRADSVDGAKDVVDSADTSACVSLPKLDCSYASIEAYKTKRICCTVAGTPLCMSADCPFKTFEYEYDITVTCNEATGVVSYRESRCAPPPWEFGDSGPDGSFDTSKD